MKESRFGRTNKIVNISGFTVIAAAWLLVASLNLFQKDRPEISEAEQRALAGFPEVNISTVVDGSAFRGIDNFVTDTFFMRDFLVKSQQKFSVLYGLDLITGDSGRIAYIPPAATGRQDEAGQIVTPDASGESPGSGGGFPEEAVPTFSEAGQLPETDYLKNGVLIYKNAAYSMADYYEAGARQFVAVAEQYADAFPHTRIIILPAPLSAMLLDGNEFKGALLDQRQSLLEIQAMCEATADSSTAVAETPGDLSAGSSPDTIRPAIGPKVRFVFVFDELWAHRGEYIYFYSDHHWTARGAYYAYRCFAGAAGFQPAGISSMKETIIGEPFVGGLYTFTGDERIKAFRDTLYAYFPAKPHTMKVYDKDWNIMEFGSSILTFGSNYSNFIAGDNPLTVINVPDNPEGLSILVIKDSYGNAMVPFLTEHYNTIYVVDPRHGSIKLREYFKNIPLTDILFLNHLNLNSTTSWVQTLQNLLAE